MNVKVSENSIYKTLSEKIDLPLAATIQGAVIEALLKQICESSFHSSLWLTGHCQIGKDAYEKNKAGLLDFYYVLSEKESMTRRLSESFVEEMLQEWLVTPKKIAVDWELIRLVVQGKDAFILVQGIIEEMTIPVEIRLHEIHAPGIAPRREKIEPVVPEMKRIEYLAYPAEQIMMEAFIEIMTKLELISDMSAYGIVDRVLREMSVSGRDMIEVLEHQAQEQSSFRKEKRLEQLKGYKNYRYMQKKWEKYCNHQEEEYESWEKTITRLIRFAEPIWEAFCKNDIFLDDWMPDLERFLS